MRKIQANVFSYLLDKYSDRIYKINMFKFHTISVDGTKELIYFPANPGGMLWLCKETRVFVNPEGMALPSVSADGYRGWYLFSRALAQYSAKAGRFVVLPNPLAPANGNENQNIY